MPLKRPHPLLQIALYLASVLLLGAVLAPHLYTGGKWLAGLIVNFKQTGTPVLGWIGQKLTAHQFDSYYNRAFLIAALGLLYPFLRWMGISRDSLGLQKNPLRNADMFMGFILAAGLLAIMGTALVQAGAYARKPGATWDAVVSQAVLPAVGASLVEEWIFRGIFLGVALRAARRWQAILAVSALFSILHLVQAPDLNTRDKTEQVAFKAMEKKQWSRMAEDHARDPASMDWVIDDTVPQFKPSAISSGSGFAMTAEIFRRNAKPALFLSEFLTLFAIGVILAWTRARTSSLWMPIGLHSGWIFLNVIFMGATVTTRELKRGAFSLNFGDTKIPLIGEQLKIGLIPLGVLAVTAGFVWVYLTARDRKLHARAATA